MKYTYTWGLIINILNDIGKEVELNHKIIEARKAWGSLKDVWKKRNISMEANF